MGMVPQSRPPDTAPTTAPCVILTRPAAQGDRFATGLAQRAPGVAILSSPLLAPHPVEPDFPPGRPDAVILTLSLIHI